MRCCRRLVGLVVAEGFVGEAADEGDAANLQRGAGDLARFLAAKQKACESANDGTGCQPALATDQAVEVEAAALSLLSTGLLRLAPPRGSSA